MGQTSSKVEKNSSTTKSASSLKRVSRLFQPGLKRDQGAASGASNRSSPPPTNDEGTTQRSAEAEPKEEGRPAEEAVDKV